ncbi:beta-1,3-glucan-binding protein [Xylocopa sonorina]|uniref:beta-1,3-glucan-binding protein n=1 Tax=Xylocopa sonorina TaxID=1818115 RepID=UPI00403AA7E9
MLAYNNVLSSFLFVVFFLNFNNFFILANSYKLPKLKFEILKPRGIRISIPDEPGLRFFSFQGNLNKGIELNQAGQISGEVFSKNNTRWIIEDESLHLVDGDVIHYWVNIQVNDVMHNGGVQTWTASGGEDQHLESPEIITGQLIFDEPFDVLNRSIWRHEVKAPLSPDYEFCVYHNEQHTFLTKIDSGKLRIKPVMLEDIYGENITTYGSLIVSDCTSMIPAECSRRASSFNILPPVLSSRLTTKETFSFRYGKIEIRAKFPEGDWLYPELWLEPKYNTYGAGYSSGRVILGLARGNDNLINMSTADIFDSRRLDCGFRTGTLITVEDHFVSKIEKGSIRRWTKGFHVYTTIWNSDGFQFLVDGEEIGKLCPPSSGWMYGANFDKMAPFDQEFYITIGVGVGGVRVFADGTTSSGFKKPWRNIDAKAMLQFWQARNKWLPSWTRENGEKIALEIDYIRVWSL